MLRVAGEIDTVTYPMLLDAVSGALLGAVDRPTSHLVIDLAGVTFCMARGLALFAQTAADTARDGVNCTFSACPALMERHWRLLFPHDTPIHYPSTATAAIAIRARQAAG